MVADTSSTQNSIQHSTQTPATEFYQWQGHRCAYEVRSASATAGHPNRLPLLLLHPVGVGLSRRFWDRFCEVWFQSAQPNPIYNPDLLGCGESSMPHRPYRPEDWADQLLHFMQTVIQQPVILVVQGALLPVAIALIQKAAPTQIRGLVLSGPPAWKVMTEPTPEWKHQLNWRLFDSPIGLGFFQYARSRRFLKSFSIRQLFASVEDVDQNWLDMLIAGAENSASRHAVFSFLSGFWRRDWQDAIAHLNPPTLVVIGNIASSISKSGKSETPDERLKDYLKYLPHGQGMQIPGRNVLPYESTQGFVEAIVPFIQQQIQ